MKSVQRTQFHRFTLSKYKNTIINEMQYALIKPHEHLRMIYKKGMYQIGNPHDFHSYIPFYYVVL